MELSEEQQIAYQKYIEGKNLFITGPGGTGKSVLVKTIYDHAKLNNKRIQVTALTGCASILLNCKAKTLHSWAGIGLGNGNPLELIEKIKNSYFRSKRWFNTDILIVDEVSMLSLKLFNLLNELGKQVRNMNRAFGGLQVIFCGDFYQLPPIETVDDPDTSRFCFESDDWYQVFPIENHIQLKKIFRQRDIRYAKILNQIREGRISRKSIDILEQYVMREKNIEIRPTQMLPTRAKVDLINRSEMASLTDEEHVYESKNIFNIVQTQNKQKEVDYTKNRIRRTQEELDNELRYIQSGLICDKRIVLKIGAQVMCVVNMNNDVDELVLCNGSQGIVTSFCPAGFPIVKFTNGYETKIVPHTWVSESIPTIGISQIPLILAWAITIHKAQGTTMDHAEIDIGSGIFECGQTYVALSRVKSLDGLYLTSFDVNKIKVNRKVKDFYKKLNDYERE